MKLATFQIDTAIGAIRRLGVVSHNNHRETLVDLRAAYSGLLARGGGQARASQIADAAIGTTMIELLEGGEYSRAAAEEAVEFAAEVASDPDARGALGERITYTLDEVRLLAPIPRPTTLRDYTGFRAHLEAFFAQVDLPDATVEIFRKRPMYYKANAGMVLGPDDVVPWSSLTKKLDFEIEPTVVIGRRGINVRPEDAGDYIAGYTILNDFSLRDYQVEEMAIPVNLYGVSKSKDAGSYPMGPWIVTADECSIEDAALIVRVNGEEWVRESMTEMTWKFSDIIAYSSVDEPILPGDCMAGGAPPHGCGADVDRWIAPGDIVECEIEGIGVLRNRVGEPTGQS